nr:NADH dehydrogenase subunit 6 [Peruphasma schultei]
MIMIMNLIMNMFFLLMKHPLSMGTLIIIQALMIAMITGMSYKSFWFSYILFLMFIGGMMVLFIYMTSLTPNMLFSLSLKKILIMLLTLMFIMTIFKWNKTIYNNDMMNMNTTNLILIKMYSSPMNISVIMLANYLLFTMITVFKITESNMGPLRMTYN